MARSFGERGRSSGGCVTGNGTEHAGESLLLLETGTKPRRSFGNGFEPETETFWKSSDKENAFFLESGRSFSWRTIPSRLSEPSKPTWPTFGQRSTCTGPSPLELFRA